MAKNGEVQPKAEVINGRKDGAPPPFLVDAIYLINFLLYVCYFFETY